MNVSEILTTVGSTVAGSVVIAYATLHLQAKGRRKALFRALLNEVRLNLPLARMIKSGDSKSLGGCPGLHTGAYDNMRLAGELLSLEENVREELQYLYEMIIMHNRDISLYGGLSGLGHTVRLDEIIQRLELLENELAKKMQKPTKGSNHEQQDWMRRYIVSQVPTFFFFGSLSILAHHLIMQRITTGMSIWDTVIGRLLLPFGIIAILWALALLTVGLNLKILSKAKRVEAVVTRLVEGDNELFYYIATVTVFGISFASVLVHMVQAGMDDLYIYILLGVALLLLLSFLYNIYLSARRRKLLKNSTTQSSESHNHDA